MSELRLIGSTKNGDLAAVKEAVVAGDDLDQKDEHGWSALSWAAGGGQFAIVQYLLEQGANASVLSNDQRTPYMIALAAGHREVALHLRKAEDESESSGESRQRRKYSKAYPLDLLKSFDAWEEKPVDAEQFLTCGEDDAEDDQSETPIVFVHEDYTVTASIWAGEHVLFDEVTPAWKEFCLEELDFKPPDDFDLLPPVAHG